MQTFNDIIAAAQALPSSDRARLITLLWDNLAAEDWYLPAEDWLQEANRRSDAVDSGQMKTDTWESVRRRARREAGLDD